MPYDYCSIGGGIVGVATARTKAYATEKDIPFRERGKMLVATTTLELERMAAERMAALVDRAERNGIAYERLGSAQLAAGIRAQAVMTDGAFVHDFLVRRTDRMVHVVNAPSPAATSALPIGQMVARQALDPAARGAQTR